MLFLAGCRKEEAKPEIPASSPESYMNDKPFLGKLAAERTEQRRLMREHGAIAERMKAMIEAKKAELKTDDLKKVQVELEKDPVWTNLYAQCVRAKSEVEAHRRKAFAIARERIAPRRSGRETASPLRSGGDAASPLRSGEDAASPVTSGGETASPVTSGGDAASPLGERKISK